MSEPSMTQVKSLEGWSATVDHRLNALMSLNDTRREEKHHLAEMIGRNRGEVDKHIDRLGREIAALRRQVIRLWIALAVTLAVAGALLVFLAVTP